MLSKIIQKTLNEQIAKEAHASNYYLSMASWCEKSGYFGSAKFLYKHSESEHIHMMKLFHYVNEAGGHALAPQLEKVASDFKSLHQVFELTYKNEVNVTLSINQLVDLCLHEKDYSTFNFLQWYVAEQHEEERLFKSILDLIRIIAIDEKGYFLIDKEIGKMSVAEKAASS